MPIRIEEISVKGLGPLGEFTGTLGDVNLIYGRNEQGKTFLTEFLLRSLFKNLKGFNLRSSGASGKVLVSGLAEDITQFSPKSRVKIEKYWEASHQGMPANIARLLVVKGAELDFGDSSPGGISKTIIRSFLSGEGTLDFIQEKKISKTIQKSEIKNEKISGPNQGKIKDRSQFLERLTTLDELLERVDQEISGGKRVALQQEIAKYEDAVYKQRKAKRHKAYTLQEDINVLEEKRQWYQLNGLDTLAANRDSYLNVIDRLEREENNLVEAREKSKHYAWLETAIHEYEKCVQHGATPIQRDRLILAILYTTTGLLLILTGILLPLIVQSFDDLVPGIVGLILTSLGFFFGYLYIRQHQKRHSVLADSEELDRIAVAFKSRFGELGSELTTLKSKYSDLQPAYFDAQAIEKRIEIIKQEIDGLESEISRRLSGFEIDAADPSTWDKEVDQVRKRFEENKKLSGLLKVELAGLVVSEEEYLDSDPGITFSAPDLDRGEQNLYDAKERLSSEEKKLEILNNEMRATIDDRKSETLDELLENLRQRRNEAADDYRDITSEILAGILLTRVIEDARDQEDEQIKANLDSSVVRKPLHAITNRYESITLDEERIKVLDKFETFDIADLSTGAQEQVLLALRIGFASRIMGTDTAFLILDDAFQHSDWRRRERLLQETIGLAERGWQILYFTMDDHIEELFDNYGKGNPQKTYKKFGLITD